MAITHLAKHDPVKLLDSFKTTSKIAGGEPIVHVVRFGPHHLAIREFPDAKYVFDSLQALADKKAAVLETPIALIEHPDSDSETTDPVLVTLWKKTQQGANRQMQLQELLELKSTGRRREPLNALKLRAVFGAVREIAKLHAAGFLHAHFHPRNVLVSRSGRAKLIDPTLLLRVGNDVVRRGPYEAESFINYVEDADFDLITNVNRDRLLRAYFDQFEKVRRNKNS